MQRTHSDVTESAGEQDFHMSDAPIVCTYYLLFVNGQRVLTARLLHCIVKHEEQKAALNSPSLTTHAFFRSHVPTLSQPFSFRLSSTRSIPNCTPADQTREMSLCPMSQSHFHHHKHNCHKR